MRYYINFFVRSATFCLPLNESFMPCVPFFPKLRWIKNISKGICLRSLIRRRSSKPFPCRPTFYTLFVCIVAYLYIPVLNQVDTLSFFFDTLSFFFDTLSLFFLIHFFSWFIFNTHILWMFTCWYNVSMNCVWCHFVL